MRFILLFLFLCSVPVTAQKTLQNLLNTYNTHSIPYISVEELRMHQLNGKVIILDSREREEFDVSHIPSSLYIGFNKFSSEEALGLIPDKNVLIVVYCSLGIRSEEISEKLKKEGFKNINNLYGGIFEWKNKGYPVIDASGKETEKVHVFSKTWGKWLHSGTAIY